MTRPSEKQRRLYRHLCKEIRLDDDARRAVTHEMFGLHSTAGLTGRQMTALTQALLTRLGRDPSRPASAPPAAAPLPPLGKLTGGVSAPQAAYARGLAAQLGLRAEVLRGVIQQATRRVVRVYGGTVFSSRCKSTLESCSRREAGQVIEALKDMILHGYDPDNLKRGKPD